MPFNAKSILRSEDTSRFPFYHRIDVYQSPFLSLWAIACGLGLPALILAWIWIVVVAVHRIVFWNSLEFRVLASRQNSENADRKHDE